MKIHFVCTGNIFRSRLAESYARYLTKARPGFDITSSGTEANSNEWGDIGWFTKQILEDQHLLSFAAPSWTQTTSKLLSTQDLVIFMSPYNFDIAKQIYCFSSPSYQVWDIKDISYSMTDDEMLSHARDQFEIIKQKVDSLVSNLAS